MAPSPWKGKGRASNNQDSRRRALERSIARHNVKRARRAEQRTTRNAPDPFDTLQAIDWPPSDDNGDDDDDETGNDAGLGSREPSENDWAAMCRANEAMSQELAHLRAIFGRNDQLTHGATPGASGSRSRSSVPRPSSAAPVSLGEPALDYPPTCPPSHTHPSPSDDPAPRRFVPLPKSKTSANIGDIQNDAGLGGNLARWLEISNIIRELMTRVGLDYGNSWSNQDKTKLGILYALILKEAPELGVFQNGWGTEWLVQAKFNNHRCYKTKRMKQRHSNVKAEDSAQGHGPPPPPPLETPSPQLTLKSPPPPSPLFLAASPLREPTPLPQPEPGPEHEAPQPQNPPQQSPPPPASPRLQREHPRSYLHSGSCTRLPTRSLSIPRRPAPNLPASWASRSPFVRRSSTSRSRYNLRTRGAAAAAAEAQTVAAIEENQRQAGGTLGSKKRSCRSESPLRLLEESDDGGRLSDEDY
ncbi:hypothetical protein RHS01_07399 [Rhizoctonia solani]|uniref:Uncharacterized protein n=1 Tax=Rhizoctonia solani TaxID=456999 RepID=A0A8H7I8C6_9AGAM|nr:hypothetical protein RHS01_07399 [Rhizoctonia solani]